MKYHFLVNGTHHVGGKPIGFKAVVCIDSPIKRGKDTNKFLKPLAEYGFRNQVTIAGFTQIAAKD